VTVLAQTYLHLIVAPSERQISETLEYVQYLGAVSAREHFRQDVELELRLEQGSLKGWLTVVGGLYLGLSNYGSLREGIDYAVKDSREFSAWIIEKFKSEVPMPPTALYRAERRLGLPGKIQRLYPLLEEASNLIGGRDKVEAKRRLKQVQDQLTSIAAELSDSGETQVLERIEGMIPAPIRNRLPPPQPPTPEHGPTPMALGLEGRIRRASPQEILLNIDEPPKPPRFR
jgi:hypothetical protein